MAEENGASNRISVSRDALRAELAEMELRLRSWLTEQLSGKADMEMVIKLERDFDLLQKTALLQEGPLTKEVANHEAAINKLNDGIFTKSQKLAISEIVKDTLKVETDQTWTSKERRFALFGVLISVGSLLASIILTISVVTHGTAF